MKKLLAIAPIFAILAACNSAQVAQPSPSQVQAIQANSQTFKCDKDTEVVTVNTKHNGDNYINAKITSPMLSLDQAAILLKQEVSASGERYVVSNPNRTTMYDWAMKGNEGALTVTTQGRTFDFACMAQ